MYSNEPSGFTICIYLISFVISIIVLIYFFRIAKDIREIRKNSKKESDGNYQAIICLIEGKQDEAIKLIDKSFTFDCIQILESYRNDSIACDQKTESLVYEYTVRYKHALPEINKEYLNAILKSVENIYFKS